MPDRVCVYVCVCIYFFISHFPHIKSTLGFGQATKAGVGAVTWICTVRMIRQGLSLSCWHVGAACSSWV